MRLVSRDGEDEVSEYRQPALAVSDPKARTPLAIAQRTLNRDDWTPVLDGELEALLALEEQARKLWGGWNGQTRKLIERLDDARRP